MDWNDLRVFLSVADAGSLRAAASQLGVSQPTAGRRIHNLEQDLAVRLFDRLRDGHRLTAQGEALLPLARQMERAAANIDRGKAQFEDTVSGTIRIACDEWAGAFLSRHLPTLLRSFPELEFETVPSHILASLTKREADFAIAESRPDNPNLLIRKLGVVSYSAYGARSYVERTASGRGRGWWKRADWVSYDEQHSYFPSAQWVTSLLDGAEPRVRQVNAPSILFAIQAGAGVGILPCFVGDRDPDLVRMMPPIRELDAPVWSIVHRDLRQSAAVRATLDAIGELYSTESRVLAGRKPTN